MLKIPHSKPTIGAAEATALARVLASGHHARGPECRAFETELAGFVGLSAAHACASGSAALVLAQRALGLKDGARILIPSLACAAVAHAVIEAGNEIVLYDGDYDLPSQADADAFPEADGLLLIAPMQGWRGPLPKWQGPVILDRCQQLSSDAPESRERAAIEVFSFYATKCISTGSGGALAAQDGALIEIAAELNSPDKQEHWRPERFNFGFDDLRAAVGREQLKLLPNFVARRRAIAKRFAKASGQTVSNAGIAFRFLVDCGENSQAVAARFAEAAIEATRPVFGLQHRALGLADALFPRATEAWQRFLSVPLYPSLDEEAVERVCGVIKSFAAAH